VGRFYVAPGLAFDVLTGQRLMVGLDTRYVIVMDDEGCGANAFGIFLGLGIIL